MRIARTAGCGGHSLWVCGKGARGVPVDQLPEHGILCEPWPFSCPTICTWHSVPLSAILPSILGLVILVLLCAVRDSPPILRAQAAPPLPIALHTSCLLSLALAPLFLFAVFRLPCFPDSLASSCQAVTRIGGSSQTYRIVSHVHLPPIYQHSYPSFFLFSDLEHESTHKKGRGAYPGDCLMPSDRQVISCNTPGGTKRSSGRGICPGQLHRHHPYYAGRGGVEWVAT